MIQNDVVPFIYFKIYSLKQCCFGTNNNFKAKMQN